MIASVKNFILPECELIVIEKEDCLHFGTYLGNMQCEDTDNKLFYKDLKYIDIINKGIDELIEKYQYELEHLDRNKNLYEKGAYDETNCILEDLKKLKGE